MVGRTRSLNLSQKLTDTTIAGNSAIVGTTLVTVYTVPTNKKARIIGAADRLVSLGANTLTRVLLAGRRYNNKTVAELALVVIAPAIGVMLIAGETIQLQGDAAGNNGSVDFSFTVLELPV